MCKDGKTLTIPNARRVLSASHTIRSHETESRDRLRRALYLPTLNAIRFNPLLGGFFERLISAGKSKIAAVGACMRKLLMIAYGVLKNRAPFDPSWRRKRPA